MLFAEIGPFCAELFDLVAIGFAAELGSGAVGRSVFGLRVLVKIPANEALDQRIWSSSFHLFTCNRDRTSVRSSRQAADTSKRPKRVNKVLTVAGCGGASGRWNRVLQSRAP